MRMNGASRHSKTADRPHAFNTLIRAIFQLFRSYNQWERERGAYIRVYALTAELLYRKRGKSGSNPPKCSRHAADDWENFDAA